MPADYPVQYSVVRPLRFHPIQLLIRLVVFVAIGAAGTSFGALFALAYVMLPLIAASRVALGDPEAYVREDGPRIVTALRWAAAVCGWVGLVVDELPLRLPDERMQLSITRAAHPTPTSALVRLVTGLPSALVLSLLCSLGALVWLWAAISILLSRRVGPGAFEYLVGLQRWSIRLLAYQASLVDAYPPFTLTDSAGWDRSQVAS